MRIILPDPEPYDGPALTDADLERLLFDDAPPPEAWEWLARQQQAEVARLRAALGALVKTEPTYDDEGVGTRCCYCGGQRRYLSATATTIDHKGSCPWLAAKALLP